MYRKWHISNHHDTKWCELWNSSCFAFDIQGLSPSCSKDWCNSGKNNESSIWRSSRADLKKSKSPDAFAGAFLLFYTNKYFITFYNFSISPSFYFNFCIFSNISNTQKIFFKNFITNIPNNFFILNIWVKN